MDTFINVLHILATAVWIGGAAFVHFILKPASRSIDPQQAGKLFGLVAKRFSKVAWGSIIILLVTGYLKTPDGLMFDTSSEMGMMLTIKHILVAGVLVVGLTIGLYVVPSMQKAAPKPGEAPSAAFIGYQEKLNTFASINLVLGVLVVIVASMLW